MNKIENQSPRPKQHVINWLILVFLSYVHITAIVGLSFVSVLKWQTLVWTSLLFFWSGVGVTGGLHRLWAHRSYKAHWMLRTFLMICTSLANQGSIYHWVRDHRTHHKYSETDADPHDARRGFFFAHIGWLLVKKDPKVIEAGRKLDMSDLEKDPIVTFQKNLDPWFSQFICFIFPTLISFYLWNESILASYFVSSCLRYCVVLHCTWLVNSAAHLYGSHPYDQTINPAENRFVAFAAVGEGWHNWHHKFPYDYAASELGADQHFNPTKIVIDVCAYLGLVTERKRALNAWNMIKNKQKLMPKA